MVAAAALGVIALLAVTVLIGSRLLDEDRGTVEVAPFEVGDGEPAPIPAERISVEATSFLPPEDGLTYDPTNTIDGDLTTAWNSDAQDTEGRGQILSYRFSEPVELTSIRFVNGYVKNDSVYTANHRIRDIMVITDGTMQPVSLLDMGEEQEVAFDFGLTSKVVLEISDVYPGTGFTDPALTSDLALSEIVFIGVQRER